MSQSFNDLVDVVARLRSPQGCPWDVKQTHESLKPYLLEETYEVLDALDRNDPRHLCDELGDLLLQVLLHAQIECERTTFGIEDVIKELTQKLIRRHPHVFTSESQESPRLDADQVLSQWETIKRAERSTKHESDSILEGIPSSLPSLLRAYQMQKRASRVGFDWKTPEQVVEKLNEELEELRAEALGSRPASEPGSTGSPSDTKAAIEHEFGDVLFTVVNIARFLSINPEEALRQASNRFKARFQYMEQRAAQEGRPLQDMTALEWDALWNAAKGQEGSGPHSPPTTRKSQDHE